MKKDILLGTAIMLILIMIFGLAACGRAPVTVALPTEESAASEGAEAGSQTPEPSPTLIAEEDQATLETTIAAIDDFVDTTTTNIQQRTLGEWIILAGSVGAIFLVFIFGRRIIRYVLTQFAERTKSDFDDDFVKLVTPQVYWILVAATIQIVLAQLAFLSDLAKAWVNTIFFVIYLSLIFTIGWKLVDYSVDWYTRQISPDGDASRIEKFLPLIHRTLRIFLVVVAFSILLDHFGVDLTVLVAALGIGGLALSLAAQDTLADMISGVTIYLDQPFRIGDRIEIQNLDTWGDVVEIGTRTTRIRTRDNRLVIVPNSTIAHSQVVNYTYPDPRYRVQSDIEVGYGQGVEETRRVLIAAVRKVDGVLPDRPVEALYNEMGDYAMIFRVRWWIESYEDTRRIYDRVHTALQVAMDEAGIISPYPTHDTNFKIESEQAVKLADAFKEG